MRPRGRKSANAAQGGVVWLTGLPGAGKTTIARRLAGLLRERSLPVEILDGDDIRKLFPATGFAKADRDAHVRRVGYVASLLERHGVFVLAALVSPYRGSRDAARGLCRRFVEVHVSTPTDVCEKRDPKGHYALARAGLLKNFTGVSDPYEAPRKPELSIDTSRIAALRAAKMILDFIADSWAGVDEGKPS